MENSVLPNLNVPVITLFGVFLLVAFRQIGRFRIHIWQAMMAGAFVVLITGQIGVTDAVHAVSYDVMLFLFGMFVVGHALEESGYLGHLSYGYFKRAHSRDALLAMVLFGAGIASALLMNDTLAIIGTPAVLLIARKHGMNPKLLLLALAFAVTIGSVMSPIGNPQNLLIALNGHIQNPFLTFIRHLCLPSLVNLGVTFLLLRWIFKDDFHETTLKHSQEPVRDKQLAFLSRISLQIVILLVAAKIVLALLGLDIDFRLTHIALAGSLPVLVGSRKRWHILRTMDWPTLAFFGAMFILMESVWMTGFFQTIMDEMELDVKSVETILGVSVVLSQFISNVPLVALYQPMLLHAGAATRELMALAAGSTIAGNLLILGAASTVIIIQYAERKSGQTLTFMEFARVGVPLTVLHVLVYWIFLTLG